MSSPPPVRFAVREIPAPSSWAGWLESLRASRGFWLLESALPSASLGRHSFAGAGAGPVLRMRADAPGRLAAAGDPFAALRAWLPRAPAEEAPIPFVGGAVGWLGYELAAHLERVAFPGIDDVGLPELYWRRVDRLVAFEHATGRCFAAALAAGEGAPAREQAERAVGRLAERLVCGDPDPFEAGLRRAAPGRRSPGPTGGAEPVRLVDTATGLDLAAFFDEAAYGKAVERIREHIAAGDLYQANLTHRLALASDADPWRIYTALRERSPAPFAAFLETDEGALVGSSPERFLRLDPDGRLESRPIKGTRPRGATPAEDARLRDALRGSDKERAENVMIVDLVRNDLGRVSEAGSVEVPELFALEPYATVWQMVSTVRGRLRPGLDVMDALRATFPPGSMTGAPKIAAVECLARLEPVRRGVYSGALGWLDVRGGADLAVVIRTLLCRPGRAWLHVGGGIVLDSEPAAEWAETLAKARALLDAVAAARRAPPGDPG